MGIDEENSVEMDNEDIQEDIEVADDEGEELDTESSGENEEVSEDEVDEEESKVQQAEKSTKPVKKNDAIDLVFAKARKESKNKKEFFKAREEGILEATGGKNPFTGEEMKDSKDIEEFLLMRKIEKDGGDPVTDYAKYLKKQSREREAEQKHENFVLEDAQSFSKANPDVDIDKLFKDPKFLKVAGKRLGKESIQEVYNDYLEVLTMFEEKAIDKAKNIVAKSKGPGSLSGISAKPLSIENMSDTEFERLTEKAKRGELMKS